MKILKYFSAIIIFNISQAPAENTALGMDFHGVVGNVDWKTRFANSARAFWYPKVIYYIGLYLKQRSASKKANKPEYSIDYFFKELLESGKISDAHYDIALSLIASYKPNQPIIELIKELKSKGYKIILHSNIGDDSLKKLQDQFPDFKLFDAYRICNKESDYASKHNRASALQLVKKAQELEANRVIMVDDSEEKLKIANEAKPEIVTILYKNPKQLVEELKKILVVE